MNDIKTSLRALVIYAVCIPLALILGYLLANPLDYQAVAIYGILGAVICAPLFLRLHYPLMLLAWNTGAIVFFLPGNMSLWIVSICASYAISFTHRILDKKVQFLSVPELTRPLITLAVVVVATMMMRGGIGLRSLGGDSVGGRYYVYALVAILGYFALVTKQIPPNRANLYIGLFLLGQIACVIGDLYGKIPSAFNFLFLFIPASFTTIVNQPGAITRLGNVSAAAQAICYFLLAKYGLRTLLAHRKGHLLFMFTGCLIVALAGGYRSAFVVVSMVLCVQFFLEGMHRTRWIITFTLGFMLLAALTIPFVTRLPLPIQRTLALLPIKVDPVAAMDASDSSEWRLQMWRVAIPMIPDYLLLGKGYGMSKQDFIMSNDVAFGVINPEDRGAFQSADFHNGPLSVIIPFGLWGSLAFLWLIWAGFKVLWKNYKFGSPELRTINTYLLTIYTVRVFSFFVVVGGLQADLMSFTAFLGLSVALNGGVARPVVAPAPESEPQRPVTLPTKPRRIGVG